MPVAVHNLSLAFEATRYFNLITDGVNGGSGFEPVILQPGETKDLSFLSLKDTLVSPGCKISGSNPDLPFTPSVIKLK